MATTAQRHHALSIYDVLYSNGSKVHYPASDIRVEYIHNVTTLTQVYELLHSPHGLIVDCSQFNELICHVAGWKSPAGSYAWDYATGAMLDGPCKHFDNPKDAGLMSIVVFGPYPGDHTAFVIAPDPEHGNPLLGSQGGENDPRDVRFWDMAAEFHDVYTFLSVVHL